MARPPLPYLGHEARLTVGAPVRSSGLIIVNRQAEVLVGLRAKHLKFLPNFLAFVGGRTEPSDKALARRWFGDPSFDSLATAVRELAEETGLALQWHNGAAVLRPVSEGPSDASSQPPPPQAFLPAGTWVTPDHWATRFSTLFFFIQVDSAVPARPDPQELQWARFASPSKLLQAHHSLELLLSRPTQVQLEILAEQRLPPAETCSQLRRAANLDEGDFEPMSGIWQLPLKTPTLPPAEHTNCYVLGFENAVVVDPATFDPSERARLADLLHRLLQRPGFSLQAVVLTHHHGDHYGSAMWLSERFKLPIWAHPITRRLLDGVVRIDACLEEGDAIQLGTDRTGQAFTLTCLHTPGHAAGHLVLRDERSGAMVVGDMVASEGTIVVDPDDGDMATYLEQLRRLRREPDVVLFPAHGPPIPSSHQKLDHYVQHRLAREAKVLQALEMVGGPATLSELLPVAYSDTPPAVWPLAERSLLAHLGKLCDEGRIFCQGARYSVDRG